jgi:shikimate dehydrogenase
MKVGLIGYPIKNTFSQNYFESKFKQLQMKDASYCNFPLETIELFPALLHTHPALNGLNVTIPYKEKIIPYLNELSPAAAAIGAVNCIEFKKIQEQTILVGHNTDAYGFEQSLKNWLPIQFTKTALVFGNGGAAKAVCYVLKKLGFDLLLVGRQSDPSQQKISYNELTAAHFKQYQLLVNCTPVGMSPNETTLLPIPYQYINCQHSCYDLIYLPAQTPFLKASAANGATVKNGLEMLHLQADAAFAIWMQTTI